MTVSHYGVEIDLDNANTSHTQVVELVGTGKRVLDVGCWTGALGQVLSSRGCNVSGIELVESAAAQARDLLASVVVADLDTSRLTDHFSSASFDVVVLADVLEHLLHPERTLRDATALLAPGGHVVISLPNVAHGSVRLALLQGRWRLTETGLLDRTHIRFYNRAGIADLLRACGLAADVLRSTVADPLRVEVEVDADELPASVVEWVRDQPDALSYQFVLSARPTDMPEAVLPILVPAEPEDSIRLKDASYEQVLQDAEQEVDRRHRLLTLRDHVIGLEAATAVALHRAAEAEDRILRLEHRLEQKNANLERLRRRLRRTERRAAVPAPAPELGSPWRRAARRLRSGPGSTDG